MRLSADDFNTLLKEPRIDWVTKSEAEEICADGGVYIDVRLQEEIAGHEIDGSIKMPLFMIRLEADSLQTEKKYVAVCDTGRKSSIAAFLLRERGFNVYVLKDGLLGSKS
ncbi:rhodanese-like domain-containing protein [Pseudomonadota bacterium]|nr:rhodanese-like domain-containing protein [Pseudomonadota bacterium]